MDAAVRMGEAAVSGTAGDTLACIGLGSCIGLALYDRRAGVAALAHIMLPKAPAPDAPSPGKYADLAVPALVGLAIAEGAAKPRLEAVLVGGAAMFALNGTQDIGARNAVAVNEVLGELRIPVRAQDTGGNKGRTIKIEVCAAMTTMVRVAGGDDALIFGEAAVSGSPAAA